MRLCKACGHTKEDQDFYKSQPYGYCRKCNNEKSRAWELANSKRKNEINKSWRARNPIRMKTMRDANNALWRAIKNGKIVRGVACEFCNSEIRIEGAHYDYSKPLEVKWLCSKCHKSWDSKYPKTKSLSTGGTPVMQPGAESGPTPALRHHPAQE